LTLAPATAAAPWRTQALLLVIMLTWGLNIVAVKALTTRIEEIWVATLRMMVASLVLTVCLLVRDRRLPRLDRRQLAALALAALLMVYLNQLLFSHGMVTATASGAALVMALSPALSLMLSAIVFRERLTRRRLAGVAAGFAGVAVVILGRESTPQLRAGIGELVVLGALLTFVCGGALVQRLAVRLDALTMGWAIYPSVRWPCSCTPPPPAQPPRFGLPRSTAGHGCWCCTRACSAPRSAMWAGTTPLPR
jgi:drug/metabolite transporter (DMT)-like permease